jgi:polysaccharide export outer membrane protein
MKFQANKSIKKCRTISCVLFASVAALVPALAQTSLPAAPVVAAPGAVTPTAVTPEYRIAPGDVISVAVADWPNNSAQATVAPDGTISMPLINRVPVAGLSIDQATALLTNKWKKYIIDPSVTVSLMQKHPQFVIFSGSIARPGTLDYRPGLHLIEALAEVGGLVVTGTGAGSSTGPGSLMTIADPSHVTVTREDGTKQTLNLTHPETLAGTSADIALEPGDVIIVPQQLGKINVIGQVRDPGVIPYRDNLTVFDAISDSGGYNDGAADLENATLIHNGTSSPINLDPMLRHGDMHANITLAPGDQISIPEVGYHTVVFGDVARPGSFIWKPGYRISDALSSVSGPTGQADLGKINVIRPDKVHGPQLVRVNFNDFVLLGKASGNPLIQPGDALYIPDKKTPLTFGQVVSVLSGVGTAAYGYNALK